MGVKFGKLRRGKRDFVRFSGVEAVVFGAKRQFLQAGRRVAPMLEGLTSVAVMGGLVPAIHAAPLVRGAKEELGWSRRAMGGVWDGTAWMAGTSSTSSEPGRMTETAVS